VPDKSSDPLSELSVRRSVERVETFPEELNELSSEREKFHERRHRERRRVVIVQAVTLFYLQQIPGMCIGKMLNKN
jgi:hypothetical protein